MKTARITIVTDPTTKKRSQQIFKKLGIDLSSGINLYLSQVALTGGIPFPIDLPEPRRRK